MKSKFAVKAQRMAPLGSLIALSAVISTMVSPLTGEVFTVAKDLAFGEDNVMTSVLEIFAGKDFLDTPVVNKDGVECSDDEILFPKLDSKVKEEVKVYSPQSVAAFYHLTPIKSELVEAKCKLSNGELKPRKDAVAVNVVKDKEGRLFQLNQSPRTMVLLKQDMLASEEGMKALSQANSRKDKADDSYLKYVEDAKELEKLK